MIEVKKNQKKIIKSSENQNIFLNVSIANKKALTKKCDQKNLQDRTRLKNLNNADTEEMLLSRNQTLTDFIVSSLKMIMCQ